MSNTSHFTSIDEERKLSVQLKKIFLSLKLINEDKDFSLKNIDTNFSENYNPLIAVISSTFKHLRKEGATMILRETLNSPDYSDFSDIEYLNLFHICDTIIEHLNHFAYLNHNSMLPFRKNMFNNSFFDKFIITKSKFEYFYNEYEISDEKYSLEMVNSNKRRPLDIDNDGFFNYICYACEEMEKDKKCQFKNACPFAHNDNEILYHPLFFRKFKCRLDCNNANCPYSHNEQLDTDLNLHNDHRLVKIIDELHNAKYFNINSLPIENAFYYENLPSEFHPSSYKTVRCPLGNLCKLDRKLCLNYHDNTDKRRKDYLYKSDPCEYMIDEEEKFDYNKQCPKENYCGFSHNNYEYMYHQDVFKSEKCPNETEDEECKYHLICPFFHKNDKEIEEKDKKIRCDPELLTAYYEDLMENYKIKQNGKLKNLNNIIKNHKCKNCNSYLLEKNEYYLLYINNKLNKVICQSCALKLQPKNNRTILPFILNDNTN